MTPLPYPSRRRRRQAGFAYIAAVILLVVVAGMAAAVVRLNASQTSAGSGAALGARASQAARAGLEWGFYQLRAKNAAGCANAVLNDFVADTGFLVSVSCSYTAYNEGQNPADGSVLVKNMYRVEATACNGTSGACPDNAGSAQPDYVERKRVATVCITAAGEDCY